MVNGVGISREVFFNENTSKTFGKCAMSLFCDPTPKQKSLLVIKFEGRAKNVMLLQLLRKY